MRLLIQLLCDNPKSWMVPHAQELCERLASKGHDARMLYCADDVVAGDILVLLSCEQIFKSLHLNRHNLVVHESDLPQGKGWSPLTWQVLEGKNRIPVTLFEAVEQVDAGPIYGQEWIELDGLELVEELRELQAAATQKLVLKFVAQYPDVQGRPQEGTTTFYPKRKPQDSEIDINKSIAAQFNLLRVVDNERYPAYFNYKGEKFIIKVYKQ